MASVIERPWETRRRLLDERLKGRLIEKGALRETVSEIVTGLDAASKALDNFEFPDVSAPIKERMIKIKEQEKPLVSRGVIYCVMCVRNGRVYIGSSNDPNRRYIQHHCLLDRGDHHSRRLQRAWDRYGASAFVFEILEVVPAHLALIDREQYWIDALDSSNPHFGYNIVTQAGAKPRRLVLKSIKARVKLARKGKLEIEPQASVTMVDAVCEPVEPQPILFVPKGHRTLDKLLAIPGVLEATRPDVIDDKKSWSRKSALLSQPDIHACIFGPDIPDSEQAG